MSFHRVIIAGLPRSGTTLLATLLAGQKDVAFITDYLEIFHSVAREGRWSWNQELPLVQRRSALARLRDQFLRMRHDLRVSEDDFHSVDSFHRAVLSEFVSGGESVAGHKARLNPGDLRKTVLDTDVHCVVLYRDPRDSTLSYFHRTGGGVERHLQEWRGVLNACRDLEGHPQLHVIRFESFLQEPRNSLQSLELALGVTIDPDIENLAFYQHSGEAGVPWLENSAFGDVQKRFDTTPLERWKRNHHSPVVRYAAWTCRRELTTFQYPGVESFRFSWREKARFRIRWGLYWFEKVVGSLVREAYRGLRRILSPRLVHQGPK